MTNQEILTQFESLVDDTLDETLEIQLANNAKNKLETELQLEILKVVDTSLTSVVGGTYLTPYALPSSPAMLMPLDTIFVGQNPRRAIPFERRVLYKDSSEFYYIDWKNNNFYLTGTIATAETITFPYIYATTDITSGNLSSTSIVWPARFHSLVAFEMAFMWFAIDQGEKFRSFSQEWQAAYQDLKNSLITWDQRLKLNAIASAAPYGDMTSMPGENRINLDR
jgi:hypothetical protein